MKNRIHHSANERDSCIGIIVILVTALVFRLTDLGNVPYGFFCDEAAFGVNAYSILKHGTDEYGTPFPLFFKSFGDYKEGIFVYSVVPLIALFGLSEWTVRLGSVIYGVINVIIIYFIGTRVSSRSLGLWAGFVAAVTPWCYHYDRVAFHCSPYLTTLLTAVYALLSVHRHRSHIIVPV